METAASERPHPRPIHSCHPHRSGADPIIGAIEPPLSLAATFVMDAVGEARAGYDYSRSGNPTRSALEETLAVVEAAFTFPFGLSAEHTLLRVLARVGDTVLCRYLPPAHQRAGG